MTVHITTFGYLHAAPPDAHITLDLRCHYRDPHVRPELRYRTARDAAVRVAVMSTPGIVDLVDAAATAVLAYLSGPTTRDVTVALGCAGGRHRAPTAGIALAHVLTDVHGEPVTLTHRDIDKDVVDRQRSTPYGQF